MATKTYYWYLHNNQLAVVESPAVSRTIDGVVAQYSSVTTADKKIRIHTISLGTHFPVGDAATTGDLTSGTAGPIDDIPIQFHEALVYRVIAMGYKNRATFDKDLAFFFDKEYGAVVRSAKKYARAGYQRDGQIIPHEF